MTVPDHLLALVRELLRRAILTLGAIPDPDLRFRTGPRTAWPPYVQETRDAYASAPPSVRTFTPSHRDLDVFLETLSWLAWYRQQSAAHAETARLYTAWVLGAPMWMLQQRCTTNRRQPATAKTLSNRRRNLELAIVEHFPVSIAALEFSQVPKYEGFQHDAGNLAQSDLSDLPTSPRFVRAPDANAYGFGHPEAVAARARDRESARSGEAANRRYARANQAGVKKTFGPKSGDGENRRSKAGRGTAKRQQKQGPKQGREDDGPRQAIGGIAARVPAADRARQEDRGPHPDVRAADAGGEGGRAVLRAAVHIG